jgi:tetratricopeptide (TPR) repeat protein
MKLFKNNKDNDSRKPSIKEDDKNWVDKKFEWLLKVYDYPSNKNIQFVISEEYFPESFKTQPLSVDSIIADISNILKIDKTRINYQFNEDIRDISGLPYEIQGRTDDCELVVIAEAGKTTYYKLIVAKSLVKSPERLVCSIIIESLKIKLNESKIKYDPSNDRGLLIYLLGIYFGFGVILAQNLISIGRKSDGLWETKWRYISVMPYQIMAYAFALYSWLSKNESPDWLERLPSEIKAEFNLSINYINSYPPLIDFRSVDNHLTFNKLFREAFRLNKAGEVEKAIATLQKMIFLTDDANKKALVFNNIGYFEQRIKEYSRSISSFLKALEFNPNYGFANDNLGLSYLLTGELDKGKEYLDKALKTGNNDNAYSCRNIAVYYMLKNNNMLAELNFQKSFSENKPVDLLHYFYAKFQLKLGNKQKAIEHLIAEIEKGEKDAIKLLKEINES